MEEFLSLLVYTLPGLLTYFWIVLFGVTPSSKLQGNEVLAISALLWIPIVTIVLLIYQIIAGITHIEFFHPKSDWFLLERNWPLLNKMSDFKELTNNLWFNGYFVFSSLFLSFHIAKFVSSKGYEKILYTINEIRKSNGKAPFSKSSTVWDEVFSNHDTQIVSVSKIEFPEKEIIGEIKNASRPLEPERNLLIKDDYFWQPVIETFNIVIVETFIDTKSGLIIRIFDYDQAMEAAEMYNRKEHLISSWE